MFIINENSPTEGVKFSRQRAVASSVPPWRHLLSFVAQASDYVIDISRM